MIRKNTHFKWRRGFQFFFFGLLLVLATSCTRYRGYTHYAPNEAYLMALSEKGSAKVAGSYFNNTRRGTNLEISQTSIQAAYSPIKHLGVVGSFFHGKEENTFTISSTAVRHYEFALGTYKKSYFRKSIRKSYMLHDFYVGIGNGSSQRSSFYNINTNYRRFFFHYGFHLWITGNIGISGGINYVNLQYNKLETLGKITNRQESSINWLRENNNLWIPEASIQVQVGIKQAKLFYSFTRNTFPYSRNRDFFIGEPMMNIGIIVEVDKFWKKKAQEQKD